jgi:phage baseplate assembly protein W
LTWGSDLAVGPTGDLAMIDGPLSGRQRIIRRLLTNWGDYVWQPTYGAGLASFVGLPINPANVRAIIRSQIFKEQNVAVAPEPTVTVSADTTGSFNTAYVTIEYTDKSVTQTQILTLTLGP